MKKIFSLLFVNFITLSVIAQSDENIIRAALESDSIKSLLIRYGREATIDQLMVFAQKFYKPQTDAWYTSEDIDSLSRQEKSYPPISEPYTSLKLKAYFWIWLIITNNDSQLIKSKWHRGFVGYLVSNDSADKYGIYDLDAIYNRSGRHFGVDDTLRIVRFESYTMRYDRTEEKMNEIDKLYSEWIDKFRKEGLSKILKKKQYPLQGSSYKWKIAILKTRIFTRR
ncbi:hypothetical protein [Xanthocytophaga agilis]|uniref:Uncharacterized protein n=1 Tax=Xanthocytophaga agilis TaxID=3048010 RepID=A0AAE3R7N6_9BACT|nr:hypothetical protein [Xanthocytophaga agilis]MDJ1505176.1 hypothetical protein [Xanthocytophaga agilis]